MRAPTPVPVEPLPPPSSMALDAYEELSAVVGGRISRSAQDRIFYARDLWPQGLLWIRRAQVPPPPDLIVWPESVQELQALVRLARRRKLPLIPFGAGSGVCGGVWAVRGGVSVDLKRLERVGQVDPLTLTVEAEAGVMGEVLERKLNAQGYTLGHFPSSIYMSTLGGWLAARSAGQLSGKYGKIEDIVQSASFVAGTGELLQTDRVERGRGLLSLLVGSEGTLGFFTSARLRVHPVPEHRTFRGVRFHNVEAGVEAIRRVLHEGLRPAAVRLYDPFDTAIVGGEKPKPPRTPPSLRGPLRSRAVPALLRRMAPLTLGRPRLLNGAADLFRQSLLILMFEGTAASAEREVLAARELCLACGGHDEGEGPGRAWYLKRYDVSYKMSPLMDDGGFADTMEVACPWERVVAVYQAVRDAVAPLAFVMCHFSHAYPDGCSLYFSVASSVAEPEREDQRYAAIWDAALGAAVAAGATVSHHHGIGLLKASWLKAQLGSGMGLLQILKRQLDPDGVMNPGKLGLAS